MRIYDIIEKKSKGKTLTEQEINFAINGFVKNKITKAQMSSLLMAILIKGMTYLETLHLTLAMKNASESIEFDEFVVDKHSTGGVSDSTTLVVVPILASLGIKVAKMSGRSLGFTGGTIDKLEVFEGYDSSKSQHEFKEIIKKINCSIISQTENIAYADKLIYDLRNETATVASFPLVASSIMSKKLAGGAKFLLLNVHYGSGALFKNKFQAIKLAKTMVKIGNDSGVKTKAIVSNMNTPLAQGVGCTNEVLSALEALNGKPSELLNLSRIIAATIIKETQNVTFEDAIDEVNRVVFKKNAKQKLMQLVKAHGGNTEIIENPKNVKLASNLVKVLATNSGFVHQIDALTVGVVATQLREAAASANKKIVGVKLMVNVGDEVETGDVVAIINFDTNKTEHYENLLLQAFKIGRHKPKAHKLIAKII